MTIGAIIRASRWGNRFFRRKNGNSMWRGISGAKKSGNTEDAEDAKGMGSGGEVEVAWIVSAWLVSHEEVT